MKAKLLAAALTLVFALSLLSVASEVKAQADMAQTVSACGTANNTPVVGISYPITQDTTGKLCTASSASIAGSTSNATSAQATNSNNLPAVSYLYAFNGATWDQLQADGSKFLKVNCATGCSGGTFNNNADGVATSATNGQSAAWLYAWNGATWDRLTDDASKNLDVKVNVALPAGTNVIGHVIADTGSTTAVTQATAANLNAAVVGVGTAGTPSGGVLTVQGAASMTKLLVTPDSVALPANQSVNVAQFNGVTPLMNNGVSGTGSQRVNIASDNTAFSVNPQVTATTGVSTKSLQAANNTTSVAVDASAGTLLAVRVFNNSATIAYAKFYNASQGSTTCGSGTPVNRVLIPASTSGAGAVFTMGGGYGVAYGTAITVCVTTGFGDSDTTAPAASTYIVEADYK